MEVTRATLAQQYGQMETPELIDLFRTGTLTQVAAQALRGELARRGVSPEHLAEQVRGPEQAERLRETHRDYYEGLPKALGRIKGTARALYVIAGLQCVVAAGFRFCLGGGLRSGASGIGSGTPIAEGPRRWGGSGSSRGIASLVNFFGPMLVGVRFGNLILSLVTVWLGVRSYKAARLWQEATPIPIEELQITADQEETESTQPAPGTQTPDWYERAVALQRSNKFADAIRAYSKALEADPNHADAYYNRAFLYSKLRKPEYAMKDLKAAARLGHAKSQAVLKSKGIKW